MSVTSEEEMAEETITNPNDAPAGSNVRIGSRGGMYYTSGNKPKAPTTRKPDEVFSGPGYEVLMFKEQTGWRVRYIKATMNPGHRKHQVQFYLHFQRNILLVHKVYYL